ncbi:recombination regulator RecX [Gracilibacillus caseinilyticus]|uniref:Regulatory protein RecX n=1 Tax=Gracilibacillus caseinilyticus TaxID=2932256 RepID=A0ABY4EXX8_9BACI|nr:recombination regulator RecX [Gracilibacillus caseinilyticus]UOQ48830.1 recombination regulator RecX [Gracilibacillus caseinilyticus]
MLPEIAKITTQKKAKDRYNIFLKEHENEYYGFSVNEDLLITFHLHKGQMLTPDMIAQIQEKDSSYKAYTLSVRYLSYRMRSEQEIVDYLIRKEVDEQYIDEVTARLKREGLIDDLVFAEALVRTRMETSTKGPLLVKKELADKGVNADFTAQALLLFSFDKQFKKVEKLIHKKLSASSKKSYQQQLDSAKQTAIQKGFGFDVISEVIGQINSTRDEEEEYNAIVFQGEKLVTKFQKKEAGQGWKLKVKAALFRKGFPADLIERFLDEYAEEH